MSLRAVWINQLFYTVIFPSFKQRSFLLRFSWGWVGPSSFWNHSAKGEGSPKVVYTDHLFCAKNSEWRGTPLHRLLLLNLDMGFWKKKIRGLFILLDLTWPLGGPMYKSCSPPPPPVHHHQQQQQLPSLHKTCRPTAAGKKDRRSDIVPCWITDLDRH